MGSPYFSKILSRTVNELSDSSNLKIIFHRHREGDPLPSGKVLEEIIELSRAIIFPGYFGNSTLNVDTLKYYLGVYVERLYNLLVDQIVAGLCFQMSDSDNNRTNDDKCAMLEHAEKCAAEFVARLPKIRHILTMDVTATYLSDPAAENENEVISCYPIIKALVNYRVAHELLKMDVPLIPRIITEMAHSETGIDIHPAAQIGTYFTIDHGTGVVIGATCVIGNNVHLYQGVTLGARSFPLDEDGNPIKHIPRHPILEDDVIVYSNATILGRVTIGKGAVIGGNLWITDDVPAGAKIIQRKK